jgi:hypothetical protein
MLHILQRLEETILEEQKALEGQDLSRLLEFSQIKARCLLELTRHARVLPPMKTVSVSQKLAKVRELLEGNRQLLAVHANAASAIAKLLEGTLQNAEADGTYTRRSCRRETAS